MRCPNCDKTVPDSLKDCSCGWSFEYKVIFEKQSQTTAAKEPVKSSSVKNSSVSEESYSALSIYTSILKGVGAVLILIGFLIAIYGVFQFGDGYIGIGSIFSGIATAFGGLVSMAIGELICVLMATEKNTSKIAELLKNK